MDLALVFENASSGGGLFNINRMLFEGSGVAGNREEWGLRTDLYASADWSGEAVDEIHPGVSWFWGETRTQFPGPLCVPFRPGGRDG